MCAVVYTPIMRNICPQISYLACYKPMICGQSYSERIDLKFGYHSHATLKIIAVPLSRKTHRKRSIRKRFLETLAINSNFFQDQILLLLYEILPESGHLSLRRFSSANVPSPSSIDYQTWRFYPGHISGPNHS